ncbi:hypothetical protein ACN23B_12320 [Anabaena sp. FACHB-709]|uniref:Uncharacterized protein n=2 Tax=Nostocaceae TaxID=1162 RepID=A0ABR6S900_ANAVA|nr:MULTISPECIES: hypothetical protein [Nostocaceae]MBC1214280.1 hypothetical protein [Trichormus variabilis ARAD]MBC1255429.1 hypothetical protein [Trichormus variabilis V5]MBC1268328.1 hypothetical protein [Trichormus variabilis FSR]MBC1302784.1 hypothetical protein [Trichormus variabilis N2B]MBC1310830.1 hypothetical protein [Trichormus variabilis PNB]
MNNVFTIALAVRVNLALVQAFLISIGATIEFSQESIVSGQWSVVSGKFTTNN